MGHWQQHFDKGLEYIVKMVVPIQLEDAKADIISTQGRLESWIADGDALEFHWINLIFWEAPKGQDLITCFRVKAERESDISRCHSKQLWDTLFNILTLLRMFTSSQHIFKNFFIHCNKKYKYIWQFTWKYKRPKEKSIKDIGKVLYFYLHGDYTDVYIDMWKFIKLYS